MSKNFLELSLDNRGVLRSRTRYGGLTGTVRVFDECVEIIVKQVDSPPQDIRLPVDMWLEDIFPCTPDKGVRRMILPFEQTGNGTWMCTVPRDLCTYQAYATSVSRLNDKEDA